MTISFGGYTCAACGWWVQNGAIHSCIGTPRFTAPQPVPITFVPVLTEERVREIVREELAAHAPPE